MVCAACRKTWNVCRNRELMRVTYLLTPWCRVLLEKPTGLQLVKKFPAFHGTRRFITALTSVCHLSLSWASPIQSIYPYPTSWRSVLILSIHLRLGLPSGLLPPVSPPRPYTTPSPHPYAPQCVSIKHKIQKQSESGGNTLRMFCKPSLCKHCTKCIQLADKVINPTELTLSLETYLHSGTEFVAFRGIQVLSQHLTGGPEEHCEMSRAKLQSPSLNP